MSLIDTSERFNAPLFVVGVGIVLASVLAAVQMLRIGDVVTLLGLGLVTVAGLLLTGISLSPGGRST
jgi:hypothetical protein